MDKVFFETPAGVCTGHGQIDGSIIIDQASLPIIQSIYPNETTVYYADDYPGWIEVCCDDSHYPSSYYKIVAAAGRAISTESQ